MFEYNITKLGTMKNIPLRGDGTFLARVDSYNYFVIQRTMVVATNRQIHELTYRRSFVLISGFSVKTRRFNEIKLQTIVFVRLMPQRLSDASLSPCIFFSCHGHFRPSFRFCVWVYSSDTSTKSSITRLERRLVCSMVQTV